jgi:hypothetical protein
MESRRFIDEGTSDRCDDLLIKHLMYTTVIEHTGLHIGVHKARQMVNRFKTENNTFPSARDRVISYVPQVRVGMIIDDDLARNPVDQMRGICIPWKSDLLDDKT